MLRGFNRNAGPGAPDLQRRTSIKLFAGSLAGGWMGSSAAVSAATARRSVRNFAELQKACAAGGEWQVLPGTYIFGDTILRPVSGTKLYGVKGKTILQKATGPGPYRCRAFFDIEDVTNITVDGFVFDHRSSHTEFALIARATSSGATKGIVFSNNILKRTYCHFGRWCEDIRYEGNSVYADGKSHGGISTGGVIDKKTGKIQNLDGRVDRVNIVNNYFEKTISEPIDINWNTWNCIITDNVMVNCNTSGVDEMIDIGGGSGENNCRYIQVKRNKFRSTAGVGGITAIYVKMQTSHVEIEDNDMIYANNRGNVGAAVKVEQASDIRIAGNKMEGWSNGVFTRNARAVINDPVKDNQMINVRSKMKVAKAIQR